MVVLHLLRCQRYLWRGLRDHVRVSRVLHGLAPLPADAPTAVVPPGALHRARALIAARAKSGAAPPTTSARATVWPWSRSLPHDPAFAHFVAQPITIPVYCGLRMIDELGHVNNAKYLEISEFARWHQLSFLGIGKTLMAQKIAFVVSDLSITYQREIGPCRKVWVRTRFVLPPEPPLREADSKDERPKDTAVPLAADKKRFFVEHEIWSADGQKLHAALTLAAALIGPAAYEKTLIQRYGNADGTPASPESSTKPPRPRTTLICEQVLADMCGLASTAEVRQIFASVEHVCTPNTGAADAVASAQINAAEDAERTDRISTLARVWKASRNALRRKTLVPRPTKAE